MGMIGPDTERSRKATLLTAASLALGGLVALAMVDGGVAPNTPRFVQPIDGTHPGTSWFESGDPATTTSLARRFTTWRSDPSTTVPRRSTSTTSPSPSGGPDTVEPATQVDVAVPAAGAQVSAGEGDGSCTTVQMTALTPEGCPPPGGEGPVIVRYRGEDPGTNGSLITARFA